MNDAGPETTRFGKYVILGELGRGGFATVYRALDTSLKREVALKILHPQLMIDPLFVTRFENDARAAAQLEHPHIVVVYDLGQIEGTEHIAMQLLPGGALATRLRGQERFTLADTLRIVEQVASALDYAHDRGFVHRDIKPSNILFNGRDEAVITDFGLVKAVETSIIARSSAGGVIGTPSYIAPEVWEGKEAGPATDIYALGCVLCELLTGQVLFAGDTSPAIMRAHFLPPRFPAAWPAGTPPEVQAILAKALAADPSSRYQRAGALADDLRTLVLRAADPLAEPYQALQTALAAGDWASALAQAQRLAAANPDYRDVRALAQRAAEGQARVERAQWAAQWRGQTLEAIQAGQWDAARVAARRWLEMAPGDGEAVQAQQTIADSMAAVQKAERAALVPAKQSVADNQPAETNHQPAEAAFRTERATISAAEATRSRVTLSGGLGAIAGLILMGGAVVLLMVGIAVLGRAMLPTATVTATAVAVNVTAALNATAMPVPPTLMPMLSTAKPFVVASDASFPPMEYVNETKAIVGFDIDMMNAVAAAMGFKVEYKNTVWDGIFAGLEGAAYDAVLSAVTVTDERKQKYDYSDPYVNAGQIVVVRTDETAITGDRSLTGKLVGAQIGTTGAFAVQKIEGAKLKEYDTIDLAMLDLLNKNVDAVVVDTPVAANYVLASANFKGKLKLVGTPFTEEYYGVLVRKGDPTGFLPKFNEGLKKIKADGTYDKIYAKWIGVSPAK